MQSLYKGLGQLPPHALFTVSHVTTTIHTGKSLRNAQTIIAKLRCSDKRSVPAGLARGVDPARTGLELQQCLIKQLGEL